MFNNFTLLSIFSRLLVLLFSTQFKESIKPYQNIFKIKSNAFTTSSLVIEITFLCVTGVLFVFQILQLLPQNIVTEFEIHFTDLWTNYVTLFCLFLKKKTCISFGCHSDLCDVCVCVTWRMDSLSLCIMATFEWNIISSGPRRSPLKYAICLQQAECLLKCGWILRNRFISHCCGHLERNEIFTTN